MRDEILAEWLCRTDDDGVGRKPKNEKIALARARPKASDKRHHRSATDDDDDVSSERENNTVDLSREKSLFIGPGYVFKEKTILETAHYRLTVSA